MTEKIKLGYVVVTGNCDEWRTFAVDLHGMQAVEDVDGVRFRMDEKSWRIAIMPSEQRGYDCIGLEITSLDLFNVMVARLQAEGVEVTESADLARTRRARRVVRFTAPCELNIELCHGLMDTTEPFVSLTGARFITGEHGMGHFAITVADLDKQYDFFTRVLGFRHTDTLYWRNPDDTGPNRPGYFLRGTGRHHLLAMLGRPKNELHHICVEVEQVEVVGRAWDKVEAGAAPIVMSLGQHANDPCISYYCQSPSGFAFEFSWDTMKVDDENWDVKTWYGRDLWGHHPGGVANKPHGA